MNRRAVRGVCIGDAGRGSRGVQSIDPKSGYCKRRSPILVTGNKDQIGITWIDAERKVDRRLTAIFEYWHWKRRPSGAGVVRPEKSGDCLRRHIDDTDGDDSSRSGRDFHNRLAARLDGAVALCRPEDLRP